MDRRQDLPPEEILLHFAVKLRDSLQESKLLRGVPPLQHYFDLGLR